MNGKWKNQTLGAIINLPVNEPVIAKRGWRPPKASQTLVIDKDEPRKANKDEPKRRREYQSLNLRLRINLKNPTNNRENETE